MPTRLILAMVFAAFSGAGVTMAQNAAPPQQPAPAAPRRASARHAPSAADPRSEHARLREATELPDGTVPPADATATSSSGRRTIRPPQMTRQDGVPRERSTNSR